MIVVNLFLTLLDVAFFVGLALACIAIPIFALGAFGRRLDRGLNPPPPRNRRREDSERAKHETHMAGR